jgi:hypothetical protein
MCRNTDYEKLNMALKSYICRFGDTLGANVAESEFTAFLCEIEGERAANARACTCDNGHTTLKIFHGGWKSAPGQAANQK